MKSNPLNLITVEENSVRPKVSPKISASQEIRATLERKWHLHPDAMDPKRHVMERERIKRTHSFAKECTLSPKMHVADLGCGTGELSYLLAKEGASVDAVDAASNAFKKKHENIHFRLSTLPQTTLEDSSYDLVLCTDVLAELASVKHRLLMSELARLVNRNGRVVITTPVDIYSEDALERFIALVETEFTIDAVDLSYNAFHIKIRNFLEAPRRFVRASNNIEKRADELKRRRALARMWYRINSDQKLNWFWKPIAWMLSPLTHFVRNNRGLLIKSEHLCRKLLERNGVSHVIVCGSRKPL